MSNEKSYSPGWCTWWVAKTLPWIPAGLGNADTWPARARAKGFHTTMTPTKGAAVCYAPGHGYSDLGHVAVVTATHPKGKFTVSEMAYVKWNAVDLRTSNMQDVAAFILAPGAKAEVGKGDKAPAPAVGVDGARVAWADMAHYLNNTLPNHTGRAAKAAALLKGLG